MKERSPTPSPADQLRQLLAVSYEPDDVPPPDIAPDSEPNALREFLAKVQDTEKAASRRASPENEALAEHAQQLLEPAPITDAFKEFIVDAVRAAHAYETATSAELAPSELGLVAGDGIFDPAQAPTLDANAFRGYLFDVISRNLIVVDGPEGEQPASLWPSRAEEELRVAHTWHEEYTHAFDSDPLEGVGIEAFAEAMRHSDIMYADDSVFYELIQKGFGRSADSPED